MIWLGLAIMIVSESATLAQIEPFWSWNTPIAWTGFILFADGLVYRARGDSWMRAAPREFAALALVSIPLWVVFEGFNLLIDNWYYTGLPENFWLRQFGYAWSFATIWPAIFEGTDLVAVWRRTDATDGNDEAQRARSIQPLRSVPSVPSIPSVLSIPSVPSVPSVPSIPSIPSILSVLLGALMLILPFLTPPAVARYLAAPVWLGFIFLLDPVNARLGGESLWIDWRAGRRDRLVNLMASGLLCGVLWEFWNYWSRAKWHYSVPIMERWKIFEMPVPGYFGFPPFALECFTMYVFVRLLATHGGRAIAR